MKLKRICSITAWIFAIPCVCVCVCSKMINQDQTMKEWFGEQEASFSHLDHQVHTLTPLRIFGMCFISARSW